MFSVDQSPDLDRTQVDQNSMFSLTQVVTDLNAMFCVCRRLGVIRIRAASAKIEGQRKLVRSCESLDAENQLLQTRLNQCKASEKR